NSLKLTPSADLKQLCAQFETHARTAATVLADILPGIGDQNPLAGMAEIASRLQFSVGTRSAIHQQFGRAALADLNQAAGTLREITRILLDPKALPTQFHGQPPKVQSEAGPATILVVTGYLLSFIALIFVPPLFGSLAFFLGIINYRRGRTLHGIAQMTLAIALAAAGMIMGAYTKKLLG